MTDNLTDRKLTHADKLEFAIKLKQKQKWNKKKKKPYLESRKKIQCTLRSVCNYNKNIRALASG